MPAELVFVLVHGAWGGAHGFRKVRGPLRAAGHEVFTPSLTGIGERAHLTSPQVRLRPPASRGPTLAGRSGMPPTGPWPRRPGATGRSPPTT